MNKTQIDAVRSTLTNKLFNHYQTLHQDFVAKLKVPASTEKLIKEYNAVLKKVNDYNKALPKDKMVFEIHLSTWQSDKEATTSLTNYELVSTGTSRSMSVVLDLAPQLRDKVGKVEDYILALTLGQENLDNLDAFTKALLS